MKPEEVCHSDPEVLGDPPALSGTHVLVRTFPYYLEGADALGDFSSGLPT